MPTLPLRDAATPTGWQRFVAGAISAFHAYCNWLVGITWKRFFVLSLLLLIGASILAKVPPFNIPIGGDEEVTTISGGGKSAVPRPPRPPSPPAPTSPAPGAMSPSDSAAAAADTAAARAERAERADRSDGHLGDVTISIDRDGVRIGPRRGAAASQGGFASPQDGASAPGNAPSVTIDDKAVEIKLPPGADSAAVREAVEEARAAVVEALRESRDAAQEAAEEAAESNAQTVRTIRRIKATRLGDPLPDLAFFLIIASTALKATYKGRIQAEVKAAEAEETAESEQLKRQVVEARMAAMQAQIEPHFLFNTLASIDHLIETDPPRASQMQKNLIALLRASMPAMREANPAAHNLGREMAVIRPYLEILKVRMEDRLQAEIHVPDGLLSAEFPSMMVQSLVENAIKHGLEPKAEGGALDVRAEIVHGQLAVTVADTGLGFGKAATAGTGIGLTNIRERLQLLYGDRASLTVADNAPSGTVVTIAVPYQAQAQTRTAAPSPRTAGAREGGTA